MKHHMSIVFETDDVSQSYNLLLLLFISNVNIPERNRRPELCLDDMLMTDEDEKE